MDTRRDDLSGYEFDAVDMKGLAQLSTLPTDNGPCIELTADENLLDHFSFCIKDQTLFLKLDEDISIRTQNPILCQLCLPQHVLDRLVFR